MDWTRNSFTRHYYDSSSRVFFSRNNSHIDSAEDFQQKMQEVGDKNGANQCSRYSDTVFAQASSEDQLREETVSYTHLTLPTKRIV